MAWDHEHSLSATYINGNLIIIIIIVIILFLAYCDRCISNTVLQTILIQQ